VNARVRLAVETIPAGIGVALMTAGISNHLDLNQGISSSACCINIFRPWKFQRQDQYGHGTHIARRIAGDA